ncbi:MAG: hypothetical protein PVI09_06220 [Anaerolineae bacterium]|jgi:cation transport regulator ChaB
MYSNIEDLPTTLRETLSEASLDLYLRSYRRTYDTLTLERNDERSRASLAHEKAMSVVEQEGVYDEEDGKWYHKSEVK